MLGASDQPLEQLPTMPKSSELIFSALQFNDAKVNAIHLNQFLKKSFDQNCIPFVGIFLKRYNMGGNCVSCQLFWAFLFDNASDICIVSVWTKKTWSQEWFTKTRSFGHISLVRQSFWSKQKQQLAQIRDCQTELVSVRCWHRLAPFLDFLQLMQCSINSFYM